MLLTEPVARIPVYDDDEEEEDGDGKDNAEQLASPVDDHPQSSPRDSSQSQELIVKVETSPEVTPPYATASENQLSQHSTTSAVTMNTNVSESNFSSISGTSLNQAHTPSCLMDRTHSQADSLRNWDDRPQSGVPEAPGLLLKHSTDSTNTSMWSKIKSKFARNHLSLANWSRSSIMASKAIGATDCRRDDRPISRRTALGSKVTGSVGSSRSVGQLQPATQLATSSSSSGVLPLLDFSLSPPCQDIQSTLPSSNANIAKYINPKLFPFPGMVKLQEDQIRGMSMSSPESAPSQREQGRVDSLVSSWLHDVQEGLISHKMTGSQMDNKLVAAHPTIKLVPSDGSEDKVLHPDFHPKVHTVLQLTDLTLIVF